MVDLPAPLARPVRLSLLFHLQAEVAQNRLLLLIAEVHILEDDVSPQAFRRLRSTAVLNLRHSVDETENTFARRDCLLHLGIDTRHLLNRKQHESNVEDEGLNAANSYAPQLELPAAVQDNAWKPPPR